jgi:hypothetical protein
MKPGVHFLGDGPDLTQPGTGQPLWDAIMLNKLRKTLVVCTACHDVIHAQRQPTPLTQ